MRACFLVMYAFLLILHFVIKDHINDLIYLFYITPKPILLIINIILIVLFYKSTKIRNVIIGLFIFVFSIWFLNDIKLIGKSPNTESDISVFYWNTGRNGKKSAQLISKKIELLNPDIIALVEAENIDIEYFNSYRNEPYNYTFKNIGNDIIVGTKGQIISISNYDTNYFFKYGKIKTRIDSTLYILSVVDIFANQPYFRKGILEDFYKNIDQKKNHIILGDFNTPYESIHLKLFKKIFWNAERKAGNGFIASWPDKYHLLQIDHIWSSKNIVPVYSNNEATNLSDHSIIFSKFKINPPTK